MENIEGPGWEIVRPRPTWDPDSVMTIDQWVPDAPWFWESLQRHCVPECCGLAAYDFSDDSVRWACGVDGPKPEGSDWRDDQPGNASELAAQLRESAEVIRSLDAEVVDGTLFCEFLVPDACARLFERLAKSLDSVATS